MSLFNRWLVALYLLGAPALLVAQPLRVIDEQALLSGHAG